jgi:uncharacterized protein
MMVGDDDLTSAEWDELEAILMAHGNDESLETSSLHGFLTAIVSGPEPVLPSEWLPAMWGSTAPVFDTVSEFERMLALIMRVMNSIAHTLTQDTGPFGLMLLATGTGKRERFYSGAWAEGYLSAVALSAAAWLPFVESSAVVGDGLATIEALHDDVPGRRLDHRTKRHDELSEAAVAIHRFFHDRRPSQLAVPAGAVRVGRNEPCPCGSGKKFKRCHGAS